MKIIVFMFNDQLQKLMMRVMSMKQKMKFMLDLTWVEILQEHIIVMRLKAKGLNPDFQFINQ